MLPELLTPTQKPLRRFSVGQRRVTRAHLALMRRPAFRTEAAKALQAVLAAIGQQLGCAVAATAEVLETEVRPPRALAETTAFVICELSARDARAALEIDRSFLSAVLERLSGGAGRAAPATRLTRIEEVALGYLALVALGALRGCEAVQRRFGARLLAVVDDRDDALARMDARQPHLCLELRLTVGQTAGVARLLVPALALQAAIQDVPAQPETELAPQISAAQVSLTPRIGQTRLELFELASLTAGDVVIFDGLSLQAGAISGPCRVAGSAFDLFGDVSPAGFVLTRAVPRALPQESSMANPKPNQDTVASLPIDVEIELARLKLSLAELAALKPGAVIPLRINAAEPVLLKVGDRAVARAELVEIENEVGARILNLLPER